MDDLVVKANVVVRFLMHDGTERIVQHEQVIDADQDPVLAVEHTANLLAHGLVAVDRMVCAKCGAPAVTPLAGPYHNNIRGAHCPTLGCTGGVWQARTAVRA